jgi:hypothetical protein
MIYLLKGYVSFYITTLKAEFSFVSLKRATGLRLAKSLVGQAKDIGASASKGGRIGRIG